MSLFDRVKSKIKEDLIIEMNNTSTDDSLDDDKNDKNKNNKNNKKITKRFKRTNAAQNAADTASKEAKGASSQIDPSEKKFVRKERIQQNSNQQDMTPSQRRSAETTRADAINRSIGGTSSTEGTGGANNSGVPVNQSSNQKPKNKTPLKGGFEDVTKERIQQKDIPKTKAELLNKRQEYGITYDDKLKRTNITKDGLEKFARRSLNKKQIDSGSNEPIKLTKADLFKARERVIGGKEIRDSKGKVIGRTTGKYGGRVSTNRRQQQRTQQPQSNARRNMNRTLNFKDLKQKFKKLGSNISSKFSNFNKRLKDPTRGFAPYKKGIRAGLGNIKRYKHGGKLALAGLIAAPHIANLATTGINAVRGREKVSSKNSKDTGPLFDTKTGQDVKFGYSPSGKPEGTVGSLFDKKVKSKVQLKLGTGRYDFRKK